MDYIWIHLKNNGMITIKKNNCLEFQIGDYLDSDKEIEITFLNEEGPDLSVWINKEEVKLLIKSLLDSLIE